MNKLYLLSIGLIAVSLSGCTSTSGWFTSDKNIDTINATTIHPDLPRPLAIKNIKWSIKENNNDIIVYTDYNSFIDYMDNQARIIRYLEQMKSIVCYYRSELNEPFCVKPKE